MKGLQTAQKFGSLGLIRFISFISLYNGTGHQIKAKTFYREVKSDKIQCVYMMISYNIIQTS